MCDPEPAGGGYVTDKGPLGNMRAMQSGFPLTWLCPGEGGKVVQKEKRARCKRKSGGGRLAAKQ